MVDPKKNEYEQNKKDLLFPIDSFTIVEPGHLRVSERFELKWLELALIEFSTRQFINQGSAFFSTACHPMDLLQCVFGHGNLQNQEKA
jgi:hypothetical protein